ncbi:hypothetical protein [Leucobacter massiliensis]|uniref:HTH tetR-type domain-containing protein n=1 Tax=Leucobacter massiliensis TaxID=1686285 RepID=A0A2S9QQU3_9MICO|nr:hypothetical protein [Leucobacter massiliensis]PRI11954.1 hypothetical protein B4915_02450 [Leucobacter massiliensis]
MPRDTWNRAGGHGGQQEPDDARARILRSATEHADTVGLTLGCDDATIERICAEAGVSSRQFARIWPSTADFLTELFTGLAIQARIDRADTQTLLTTWQFLSSRGGDLRSVEGRRGVLIDVIRTAAEYNFDVVTASGKWRTYAALSTTILSWPEGESRARVLEALRASQLAFVETMESFYRNVLPTIGYRLRDDFHDDYQPFVVAAASVIEGLGVVRSTVPALVEAHFEITEGDEVETWSVAALAFKGVLDAFFELDPDFEPDEAIARLNGGVDVTPASAGEEEF